MAAPATWSAPASGGEIPGGRVAFSPTLSYANGYWVALTTEDVSGSYYWYLRTATDPSGTWTERAIPELSDMTALTFLSEVFFDGTYYAFAVGEEITAGVEWTVWIYYATDPTGTWNYVELSNYSSSTKYLDMAYDDGSWVLSGMETSGWSPILTYSTSVLGTWSHNDSLGGTGTWVTENAPRAPCFDGANWILKGPSRGLYYASSLAATTWTSIASSTSTIGSDGAVKRYGNYVISFDYYGVQYASSATSTWTFVSPAVLQLDGIRDFAFNGRYWVAVGSLSSAPRITYCDSRYPLGTSWTLVSTGSGTGGFTGDGVYHLECGDGLVVAGAYGSANTSPIRWASASSTAPTTYLRQRQSPVRSPSRVSPVNLRNRQTTMIR